MNKLPLLILVFCITLFNSAIAKPSFEWSKLQPLQKEINDPFANLTNEQLDKLGYYLGLVNHLNQQQLNNEKLKPLEQKKQELEAWFKAEKLNIESLLSQRQNIIKQRTLNATNVNQNVIDKEVSLTGYIVPLNANEPKLDGIFLREVSPYIIIGHQHQSPDANQTIWIEGAPDLAIKALDQAVTFKGILKQVSINKTVTAIDGYTVNYAASYQLINAQKVVNGEN